MPITPQNTYERIWQLATQFSTSQEIRRADLDADLNDIAEVLSGVLTRTTDLENASIQPSGNLILNPEFAVNTLNYGGAQLGLDEYAHNRWKAGTVNTQYTVAGDVVTLTAGSLKQVIDGRSIVTGTYSISWTGAATCQIDGVGISNGGTVDLTNDTEAVIEFSNGDFSYPYLTIGTAALAYRARPYEQEFQLCRAVMAFPFDTAVTTAFIHESVVAFSSFGETAIAQGNRRVYKRVAAEPPSGPKIQSADGAWWEYVPPSISGSSEEARITALETSLANEIARIDANVSSISSHNTRLQNIEQMQIATLNATPQFQQNLRVAGDIFAGASGGGDSNIFFHDDDSNTDRTLQWSDGLQGFFMEGSDGSLYRVWHAGNHGSGSGLDADRLDNLEAAQFVRSDQSSEITGKVSIKNSSNEVLDLQRGLNASRVPIISFYNGFDTRLGLIQALATGMRVFSDLGGDLRIQSADVISMNGSLLWHAGNDGASSGLDADAVDGVHASQFLRSDVDDSGQSLSLITLRLVGGDASLSSTNHGFQIGPSNGVNLIIDQNEIMARDNGAPSSLFVQNEGGDVFIDGHLSYHAGNAPFLTGVRLGALTTDSEATSFGSASSSVLSAPDGSCFTDLQLDLDAGGSVENVVAGFRPIQRQINGGAWITVSEAL